MRYVLGAGDGVLVDLTAVGNVVTASSVVPLSDCCLVVCSASVLLLGVVGVKVVVMCCLGAVVISKVPVLVSVWRVVGFIGVSIPAVGSWVWLDGIRGVGRAAMDDCGAELEAVEDGAVCSTVASVGDPKAELLVTLLSVENDVAGGGGVVGVVVVGAVVVAAVVEAFTVSSSVTENLLNTKSVSSQQGKNMKTAETWLFMAKLKNWQYSNCIKGSILCKIHFIRVF